LRTSGHQSVKGGKREVIFPPFFSSFQKREKKSVIKKEFLLYCGHGNKRKAGALFCAQVPKEERGYKNAPQFFYWGGNRRDCLEPARTHTKKKRRVGKKREETSKPRPTCH